MIYAGIGSRKTPPAIQALMMWIGEAFAREGYVLRSGNADGADRAFAAGANKVAPERVRLYLPRRGWNKEFLHPDNWVLDAPEEWTYETITKYHPRPGSLRSPFVRALMARNAHQVFGSRAERRGPEPRHTDMVICWAPNSVFDMDKKVINAGGGTGQAVRIAAAHSIPVWNLVLPHHRKAMEEMLQDLDGERSKS